ncbi:MAG: anti-sigma F factor antagonist [Dethiobacteria bacterium]|jgi:stage II sporulation protein AA (anti-sigma F factor antagonist)
MKVQLIRRKDCLLVRLKGELDHHSSIGFKEAVERELQRDEIRNLVLNFEHLTFMDSSGLSVILGRYKQIKARRGKLVICSPGEHLKKILQIGGLLKIIPIYSSEDEALSTLS